jgi:hypothetical protein
VEIRQENNRSRIKKQKILTKTEIRKKRIIKVASATLMNTKKENMFKDSLLVLPILIEIVSMVLMEIRAVDC